MFPRRLGLLIACVLVVGAGLVGAPGTSVRDVPVTSNSTHTMTSTPTRTPYSNPTPTRTPSPTPCPEYRGAGGSLCEPPPSPTPSPATAFDPGPDIDPPEEDRGEDWLAGLLPLVAWVAAVAVAGALVLGGLLWLDSLRRDGSD